MASPFVTAGVIKPFVKNDCVGTLIVHVAEAFVAMETFVPAIRNTFVAFPLLGTIEEIVIVPEFVAKLMFVPGAY